jgi:hypothetical protein
MCGHACVAFVDCFHLSVAHRGDATHVGAGDHSVVAAGVHTRLLNIVGPRVRNRVRGDHRVRDQDQRGCGHCGQVRPRPPQPIPLKAAVVQSRVDSERDGVDGGQVAAVQPQRAVRADGVLRHRYGRLQGVHSPGA